MLISLKFSVTIREQSKTLSDDLTGMVNKNLAGYHRLLESELKEIGEEVERVSNEISHRSDLIEYIEEYLGEELGPNTTHHFIHRNLVSTVYFRSLVNEGFEDELVKAAVIRKSLG